MRRLALAAIAATALAYAIPLQPVGCNQTSHYAAVQSYARGTPRIDRFAAETCDTSWWHGHFYAAKSPGLPLVTVPWYLVLRAAGAVPRNAELSRGYPAAMLAVPRRAIWQLALWGVVLPALGLVLLTRGAAERVVPGTGIAVGVAIGLGTLLLPFATLFFSHVLSTFLVFAAFALLLRERDGPPRAALVAGAGLAAGLAVSTEYPVAVVAGLVGLYALARGPRLRRAAAYAGGAAAGLLPLVLFNVWAFGNPAHVSYTDAVITPGRSGHDVVGANTGGFFGVEAPRPRVAVELLLSGRGLLVLSPLLLLALAGLPLLWRRGRRAEALLAAGVLAATLLYSAGYRYPFGGWAPGPRFLIPAIPFLALPLAAVARRLPVTAVALAAVSVGAMTLATAAEPLLPNDRTGRWVDHVRVGTFTETVVTLAGGGRGWLAILPFLVLVAAGAACAIAATRLPARRLDVAVAAAALAGWVVLERGAPALLRLDAAVHQSWGHVAAVVLAAALVAVPLRIERSGVLAALPALPLVLFASHRFDEHSKWALLLGLLVLAALVLGPRLRRSAIPA